MDTMISSQPEEGLLQALMMHLSDSFLLQWKFSTADEMTLSQLEVGLREALIKNVSDYGGNVPVSICAGEGSEHIELNDSNNFRSVILP